MKYLKKHRLFICGKALPKELELYSQEQIYEILDALFQYHLLFKIYDSYGLEKYALTNRGRYVTNKINNNSNN